MKRIFMLMFIAAAACSGPVGGSDEPPAPRPGADEPREPAVLSFNPSRADFAASEGVFEGSFAVEVRRRGKYLPDTLYNITVADTRGALTMPRVVVFDKNAVSADIEVGYSLTLASGESYSATVTAAGTDAELTVGFRNTSEYVAAGTASYRHPAGRTPVRVFRRETGGATEYTLFANGLTRVFTVGADGSVLLSASAAGIEGYETVNDLASFTSVPPAQPGWSVRGATDGEGTFVLAAVYTSADGSRTLHHDTVTFDNPESGWTAPADAVFTDGWLLGVVSFEARPPLVPADNPWKVEYRESRSRPGLLRLCNIYRGDSPLGPLNAGPALSYILVDATDPANVVIAEQDSGFGNTDLFAVPFHIGGTGTMTTEPDGTRTITIPQPVHNGYGTWGATWAAGYSSIIRIPPRS